jgi:hypothetical protein
MGKIAVEDGDDKQEREAEIDTRIMEPRGLIKK